MHDFFKTITKNNNNNIFITATVSSLVPLGVKIIPTDDEIKVVETTSLSGLKVGSRLLLLKLQDQFIALAVIGSQAIRLIETSSLGLTDTTMVDTDLEFTFNANSTYKVSLFLSCNGDDANGIDLDWSNTGTIPSNQSRKTIGQAFGETNREDSNVCVRQSYLTTDIKYGCDASNTIYEEFILKTTTAGTMTLRAAKYTNSVSGTNTTISSHSYIIVKEI